MYRVHLSIILLALSATMTVATERPFEGIEDVIAVCVRFVEALDKSDIEAIRGTFTAHRDGAEKFAETAKAGGLLISGAWGSSTVKSFEIRKDGSEAEGDFILYRWGSVPDPENPRNSIATFGGISVCSRRCGRRMAGCWWR